MHLQTNRTNFISTEDGKPIEMPIKPSPHAADKSPVAENYDGEVVNFPVFEGHRYACVKAITTFKGPPECFKDPTFVSLFSISTHLILRIKMP